MFLKLFRVKNTEQYDKTVLNQIQFNALFCIFFYSKSTAYISCDLVQAFLIFEIWQSCLKVKGKWRIGFVSHVSVLWN